MKRMIALLLLPVIAHGRVLVPAPDVKEQEYRAILKIRPDDSSPIQKIRRQRPSQARRDELLSALARAQQAFVSQSTEVARTRFLEMVELKDRDDWDASDRSVIKYAYLRLAQLDPKASEWLENAAGLGEDATVERSLFPPPLLAELELRRSQLERIVFPEEIFRDWPVILVNGRVCTQTACAIEVARGPVRVTWLSDRFQPHTEVLSSSRAPRFDPPRRPWLKGSCERPEFSEHARSLGEVEPFFGLSCANAVNIHRLGQSQGKDLPLPPVPKTTTSFYKSKWLWIGVGAAVTAVILASQNKKKEDREPSTTYGY